MALRTMTPRLKAIDLSTVKPLPKTADPIYSSERYAGWRKQVIARAGGRCQADGCARQEPRMFADHIRELKDGGAPFDVANGQCLCGKHHTLKTNAARDARMGVR